MATTKVMNQQTESNKFQAMFDSLPQREQDRVIRDMQRTIDHLMRVAAKVAEYQAEGMTKEAAEQRVNDDINAPWPTVKVVEGWNKSTPEEQERMAAFYNAEA